ncbi:hypothetical protein MTR_4g076525 [Medicago truncatula]|uniref:Uncharacterized protein n=1 Tax=Medicago truncatula TaxID=3880 RepID=A0A072UMK9_MEDTR|nr:hypothetical protein MTR_4g076525 [Medicago truncatula]
MPLSSSCQRGDLRQILESNLGIGKSKLGFLGEKLVFPESCTVTASSVSCSCIFFTRFRFELGFGVKMKVVDNFVSFPMTLVWSKNDFWFRSYDENTPRRSQ